MPKAGSAAITAPQVVAASRSLNSSGASAETTSTSCGSNCDPLLPGGVSHPDLKLDVGGVWLAGLALVAIIYPLIQGQAGGWPAWTFALLAAGAALLCVFVRYERRRSHDALIEPSLLANRMYLSGIAVMLSLFGAFGGLLLCVSLYGQLGEGWSPIRERSACRGASAGSDAPRPDRLLAGELVPGFLDGLAQRGVTGQRVARDVDGARGEVDVDPSDPREPADLGPHGADAVLAGHPGDGDGTGRHAAIVTADSDAV